MVAGKSSNRAKGGTAGKRRKPAPRQKQQRAPQARSGSLGPALAIVVFCGLLVGLNNAGLIPAEWTAKLVIGRAPGEYAEPRNETVNDPEPQPARPTPPVPAAKPPRPVRQSVIQPTPAPQAEPEPKPEPEPAPAKPRAQPTPQRPETQAKPVSEPARRTDGVLTVAERRERLVSAQPPPGFTTEWSGGPALLKVAANEIARGNPERKRVALTLDGCFEADQVPAILEILKSQGITVTFFLTGIFTDRFPDAVRKMAAGGHEIAHHSWDHPSFTKLDDAAILEQMERTERALLKLAPKAYKPYFRPPFGDRDVRVLRLLLQQGFLPVYWTVDTLDWQKEATPESVLDKVAEKGLEPGAILLCHVGSKPTLRALPRMIVRCRAANLEPGPVSAVLTP